MTLHHENATADARPVDPGNRAPMRGTGSLRHGSGAYRPDIDGLRAVAVAIVVIFHTGVSPLRGGFIGVDIFFVISGFLITRLISEDIARGGFTILGFYERRIRRILPALLVAVAATLLFSPFVLFPSEIVTTGITAVASIASVANLYLLGSAGYFAADAGTQPLIHMWSLGVEEQFYLFFPLLLAAFGAARWAGARWATIAATVLSFAACVAITRLNRDFAYYFPLTRAWELLVGALLVFIPVPTVPRLLREAAAFCALVLIFLASFKFYAGMAFPGFYAIAPCLAAVTLIAVGQGGGSLVSQLLSTRPMVAVGQLSYSLYLWHWPIFVYYRLVRGAPISVLEAAGLVAASVAAAYLSWRFVERPFRDRRLGKTRAALFGGTAIAGGVLTAFAAAIMFFAHAPAGSQSEAERLAGYLTYDDTSVYRRGRCFLIGHLNGLADYRTEDCLRPASGKPNMLIVGDSHAAHLWSGMRAVLPDVNVMQATATGCKPVLDPRGEKTCIGLVEQVFGTFLPASKPDILVLSARWIDSDIPDVVRTLEALRNDAGQIVVMGPIVEYSMPLPRLLAQIADGRDPALLISARAGEQQKTDQALEAAVRSTGATYVSTYRLLCAADADACLTTDGGIPLQWDYGHLTEQGSAFVAAIVNKSGALRLPSP